MDRLLSLAKHYWWLFALILALAVGLWVGQLLRSDEIKLLGYLTSPEVRVAMDLYSANRLDEAAIKYQAIVKARPDDLVAWNNLGNVLRDLGRQNEAAAAYLRVIEIEPKASFVYRNLVTLYQLWPDEQERSNKLIGLEPVIKRALQLSQDNVDILDAAITYYRELGNDQRANELQAELVKLPK